MRLVLMTRRRLPVGSTKWLHHLIPVRVGFSSAFAIIAIMVKNRDKDRTIREVDKDTRIVANIIT